MSNSETPALPRGQIGNDFPTEIQDGFPSDRNLTPGNVGNTYRLPDATPDNFVCLRGPCRHYWHLVTDAHVGNPEGTFESMGIDIPRLHHHVCLLNPGQETEFEEDNAYSCSRWDPADPKALKKLEKRREAYFRRENKITLRVLKSAAKAGPTP